MPLGTIRIGSRRKNSKGKPVAGEQVIFIDRSNQRLGNPIPLIKPEDPVERKSCIGQFRRIYTANMEAKGAMYQATAEIAEKVKNGENVILMCWCKPEYPECHGDVIKEGVLSLIHK